MKKYIDPQAEILCLHTADIITESSGIQESVFNVVAGSADFNSTTYSIDDGFWG